MVRIRANKQADNWAVRADTRVRMPMRTGTALGGLYINAHQRGATTPWAKRVTRQDSAVTRFCGALLNGQARAFWAPDGAAGVTGRPTTAF